METNPHWTALLARRRTPRVDAVMTTWWEHVLRFSRRDQLAFSVVMAASGLRLNSVRAAQPPLAAAPLAGGLGDAGEGRREDAAARRGGNRAGDATAGPAASTWLTPRPCAPRSRRSSATPSTRTRWVWDLEARMAAATANVRRLRDQLESQRSS